MESHTELEQDTPQNVYVVYGRNKAIQQAMYDFLGALGLQLLTKEAVVNSLQQGAPFTDDVLASTFKSAKAIIIFFSAEEQVRLRRELWKPDEQNTETEFSPRPGIDQIFEAGYALGGFSERTILLQVGQVQLFSDIDGRDVLPFSGKIADCQKLIARLRSIGCILQENGNKWMGARHFQQAFSDPQTEKSAKRDKPGKDRPGRSPEKGR
jgi:hypothetical protein